MSEVTYTMSQSEYDAKLAEIKRYERYGSTYSPMLVLAALTPNIDSLPKSEPVGTVVDPTYVQMDKQLPYGTKLYTSPQPALSKEDMVKVLESIEALLSNEEHAASGGMRSYAVGSPTWELWEDLKHSQNIMQSAIEGMK